jgi:hypothetical protein
LAYSRLNMKKLILPLFLISFITMAAYFPSTNLTQGGNNLSTTNPLPNQLSDGTSFYKALTDTELRATPLPVSGTFWQATQPASQSGTWTTGRTWSLLNTTDSVNVGNFPTSFNIGNFPTSQEVTGTFWQATQPISVATIPTHAVTQSGTWDVRNITGTVSLPTDAATSALQNTQETTLNAIQTALSGLATSTGQVTELSSLESLVTNTTGIATTANQAITNASLSSIDAKLTSPLAVSFSGGGLATSSQIATTNATLSAIATNTQGFAPATTMTGALGELIFGSVTTTAPTYTTATQNSLSLTTAGALRVDASATTQPISNASLTTIATNSGTQATAANQTSIIGAKTAGTAAASSMLGGGVYLTTPPTMTNNQQAALQMNVNGALKVDASAAGITIAGVATTANQATEIASLSSLVTNSGVGNGSLSTIYSNQTNGLQKTQFVDSTGAIVGSTNANGVIGMNVALSGTNFIASTLNSTAAQLAAAATFTGTIETILSQQSISLNVTSDQPGTLTLHQYSDAAGTFELPPIVITHLAGVGINKAVTINGSYIKLTYQNTGASTTTTFNMATYYGILPATTELGNGPVAVNEIAGVATSPLVKGTQGTNGFTVQALHDAGRNKVHYFMAVPIITTATDTLVSLTGYTDAAGAVAATTTPAVITTGKKFRLTGITIAYINVTAEVSGEVNLRVNNGGVVAITSPVVESWETGNNGRGTAGEAFAYNIPLDMEFNAGSGLGISIIGRSTTMAAAAGGYVKVSLTGYEY